MSWPTKETVYPPSGIDQSRFPRETSPYSPIQSDGILPTLPPEQGAGTVRHVAEVPCHSGLGQPPTRPDRCWPCRATGRCCGTYEAAWKFKHSKRTKAEGVYKGTCLIDPIKVCAMTAKGMGH
jgi:hypothetical protein